ncbi:MAG: hypothetical protein ACE3L7_04940 [Candidatus Pristimantibacillus sp.]
MFDPTIFENLKVAFENEVYDLDNLDQRIHITNRIDTMEMSVLSREFAIQFALVNLREVTAEIRLDASLKDLAAEILELPGETPGCSLRVRFYMAIKDVSIQCKQIEDILQGIWSSELPATQTLSFIYSEENTSYRNVVELKFKRRISEDQMEDIPNLVEHILQSLAELNKVIT